MLDEICKAHDKNYESLTHTEADNIMMEALKGVPGWKSSIFNTAFQAKSYINGLIDYGRNDYNNHRGMFNLSNNVHNERSKKKLDPDLELQYNHSLRDFEIEHKKEEEHRTKFKKPGMEEETGYRYKDMEFVHNKNKQIKIMDDDKDLNEINSYTTSSAIIQERHKQAVQKYQGHGGSAKYSNPQTSFSSTKAGRSYNALGNPAKLSPPQVSWWSSGPQTLNNNATAWSPTVSTAIDWTVAPFLNANSTSSNVYNSDGEMFGSTCIGYLINTGVTTAGVSPTALFAPGMYNEKGVIWFVHVHFQFQMTVITDNVTLSLQTNANNYLVDSIVLSPSVAGNVVDCRLMGYLPIAQGDYVKIYIARLNKTGSFSPYNTSINIDVKKFQT